MIKRMVKEPLVHFLLLGLALFVIYEVLSPPADANASDVIQVNRTNLLTFYQYRARAFDAEEAGNQLDNMPAAELNLLIDDYVREEALYREALSLGLDRNDYVVKRRLVQSVEFIADGVANAELAVSDEQLQSYFVANREDYYVPATVTFTHVFVDLRQRDKQAAHDAAKAKLAQLNAQEVRFSESTAHGDRFLYHVNYVTRDAGFVASHFGDAMAEALFSLEPSPEDWRGPFESPYGYHLVLLTRHQAGRYPALEDIAERVYDDALRVEMRNQKQAAIDAIVRNFDVSRTYKPELSPAVDSNPQ